METVSPELTREIERRLAEGQFVSLDELLRHALNALDDAQTAAAELLERELLKALDGDEVEVNAADWEAIETEAMAVLKSRQRK